MSAKRKADIREDL